MPNSLLSVRREGGVARVTLSRPDVRNAFNAGEVVYEMKFDTSVRLAVDLKDIHGLVDSLVWCNVIERDGRGNGLAGLLCDNHERIVTQFIAEYKSLNFSMSLKTILRRHALRFVFR